MHEPIIVLIVLPLAHVSNYRDPWVLRGSSPALEVQDHIYCGFKYTELHGCGKFHDLEGPLEWSRDLLLKFLEDQKTFPPVSCGLVQRMLPPSPRGPLLSTYKSCRQRRRKRRPRYGGAPQQALSDSKRRR